MKGNRTCRETCATSHPIVNEYFSVSSSGEDVRAMHSQGVNKIVCIFKAMDGAETHPSIHNRDGTVGARGHENRTGTCTSVGTADRHDRTRAVDAGM